MAESARIPTLDGWRAVAISLVIAAHGLRNLSRPAEKLGALGVNLFFAISGYLICTMLLRERERTGTISLRSFYIRRVFRIMPPALLYLLVVALLAAFGVIAVARNEVVTAILTANYFPDRLWYTEHFWSLSIEEHFYLVWPGMLALLGPKRAAIAGLVLAALCIIYRPWEAAHIMGASTYRRTEMRLDAFVIPCVLAIILRNRHWEDRAKRWLTPWVCVLLFAVIVGVAFSAEGRPQFNSLNKFIQAAFLPLIVISSVMHPAQWIGRILETRLLQWIGGLSYGIYLWQEMFLVDTSSTMPKLMTLPLAITAIFACAMASYYWLEQPLRRFGHSLATKARVRAQGSVVPS